jgi:hypothetical protein
MMQEQQLRILWVKKKYFRIIKKKNLFDHDFDITAPQKRDGNTFFILRKKLESQAIFQTTDPNYKIKISEL